MIIKSHYFLHIKKEKSNTSLQAQAPTSKLLFSSSLLVTTLSISCISAFVNLQLFENVCYCATPLLEKRIGFFEDFVGMNRNIFVHLMVHPLI